MNYAHSSVWNGGELCVGTEKNDTLATTHTHKKKLGLCLSGHFEKMREQLDDSLLSAATLFEL